MAPESTAATIYISPVNQSVTVGNAATVEVRADADDLTGFQFDFLYDSTYLALNWISAGTVFDPDTFFMEGFDDLSGTVMGTIGALIGPGSVSGSNLLLATFEFSTLTTGEALVSLDFIQLLDGLGEQMQFTIGDPGSVRIGPKIAAIPEPTTYLLAGAGLLAGLLLRRRQRSA
jgi:hypothetical protein